MCTSVAVVQVIWPKSGDETRHSYGYCDLDIMGKTLNFDQKRSFTLLVCCFKISSENQVNVLYLNILNVSLVFI